MMRVVKYTDSELIAGCRQGNPEIQKALYQNYHRSLYGVCLRYTNCKADADDIFQDAFIKVFKSIDSFRGNGSLEGWVRRIIVNTALEFYRKNSKLLTVVDIEEAKEVKFDQEILSNFGKEDILAVIRSLPTGYRAVFNLYVIEGYSHQEISLMLNISVGTSKSQLSRAKALLKKSMEQLKMDYYAG